MPMRSKKSRVKKLAKAKTTSSNDNNEEQFHISNDREIHSNNKEQCEIPMIIEVQDNIDHNNEIRIEYVKQILGHFHQGDMQFSDESRGAQCSCNALVMLCRIPTISTQLNSEHLDEILRNGDNLYIITSNELRVLGQLHDDSYLDDTQLPKECTLLDNSSYTIKYDALLYCKYEQNNVDDLPSLDVQLQEAFNVSNSTILILGSYMMAIYKDCSTGNYIYFDSHSRNEFGFPIENGNSVALVFKDFDNLHSYLKVLCRHLNVTARTYGIQPVHVTMTKEGSLSRHIESTTKKETRGSTNDLKENEPGCSTWSSDHFDISTCMQTSPDQTYDQHSATNKMTTYQIWYQNLSPEEKNERLAKKRKMSKDKYKIAEHAAQTKLRARAQYAIPENAERKRQQSKQSYADPENAERKRQQSRSHSKQSYANPENAKRKRLQSKQSYANPDNAKSKIDQIQASRYKKRLDINIVVANFQKSCKEDHQLIYICQICQRVFFKRQVRALQTNTYNKSILVQSLPCHIHIDTLPRDKNDTDHNTWICRTCHEDLVKIRIPKLATVNNLALVEQPQILLQLNMLERHLISPAILFMKMIPLIKGAQKGINGQVVCVKANVNNTATCLPRLPTEQSLLRIKLKRRLNYKGHHMCQNVNPENVRQALKWLKDNNTVFQDIDINFDEFDSMSDDQLISDQQENPLEQVNEIAPVSIATNPIDSDSDNTIDYEYMDDKFDDIEYTNKLETEESDMDTEPDDDNITTLCNGNLSEISSGDIANKQCNQDHDISVPCRTVDNYVHVMQNSFTQETYVQSEINDAEESCHNFENDEDEHNRNDDQSSNQEDSNTHNDHDDNSTTDNEKDNEDDITNTSAPLYSFLHPVDFAQYLADKHDESILCIAPGEGNKPENVLQMESKCFPAEFPTGLNTFNEMRENKLSPSRYFNARLFAADNRFARNPEYIFFALYATEVQQISDNISIALRRGSTRTTDGQEITAAMLTDHEQLRKLIRRDEGYRFLAHIRGTPAYWEKSKKDVFAMIRQLGIPTFFLTFSAADRRWIEIDNAILVSQGKRPMTVEEHKNMTWEEHCNIIMSNPAIAARMFQERVYTFINNVILSPANPIGQVEDYYYRTEFQQRGWPHIHMIVWVKDAPIFDMDSDDAIVQFIDKYVTCELPPEDDVELHEIVSNVQIHTKRHTKSCRKTGQVCRFNFPKPPSNSTFICRLPEPMDEGLDEIQQEIELAKREEKEKDAKNTLREMWNVIENNELADFDEILRKTNITHSQFQECLTTLAKRNTVYLKRRVQDQWVNNYNPHLIRCWNGNMDIQYILDPFAATMYMLSYLTKSEREMGDLLRNAQREARQGNEDALTELRKLGSVYLQHREVSVMGAIYLVCSMPLKQSSRNVVFVQTDVHGQKISLPLRQLQENAGNSEEVWMTSQIEKYIGRPRTARYKNMSMAKFYSTHYQVSSKSDTHPENQSDNESDNEQSENEQNDSSSQKTQKKNSRKTMPIKLKNCSSKMKERTRGKPAVIRYPRVSINRDKERYYMNMLRLYLPHTTKELKPPSYSTYESYYLHGNVTISGETESVQEIVRRNMKEFEPDDERVDEAWDALQQIPDFQDAWNSLNPQGEQQRLDDRLERNLCHDSDDDLAEIEIPEFQQQQERQDLARCAIETCRPEITEEQAQSMMRQLNEKQRQLFNHVAKWCNEKARDHTVSPFHIFLTGGAGTGKSHLIRCITHYAKRTFASLTEDVDEVTVLLVAHTGTAAFNISGETICSSLKVPRRASYHYDPLKEERLNPIRMKYRHVQLVIIDEISMVSVPQLDYIHGRLQQIKGTSNTCYFGNVSILAVGDFYQLPPIRATPLCYPRYEVLKDLWHLFKMVELTEIMRQRDDVIFAEMLNRLRTRKADDPISDVDKQLLQTRVVSENGLSAPDDALHLFFKNTDVNAHNDRKLASLTTPKYTIDAIDIDQKGGQIIRVNKVPHKRTSTDDTTLADEVKLAVGARVMVISNVDVSDGLCNGVCGIVKGIEFCNNQNMPAVVYVQFDSASIGTKARTTNFIPPQYEHCVPIKPRQESFKPEGKSFTTTRKQMPLKLAWAVTIHKVQGQTTDQAVISMKNLRQAMAYVAISRVTHIDGVYLTNFDVSKIICDERIADCMSQMPMCDLSLSNPLSDIDHCTRFIIVHHNIQSLNCHLEDLKSNTEIRNAHVICLSETWLDDSNLDPLSISGYSMEVVNSGKGRGVAMYIQNSVQYNRLHLSTEYSDVLAIRTCGNTNMLIVAIYKPVATTPRQFTSDMNDVTAHIEVLDTDYNVLVGDFNRDLLKDSIMPVFRTYKQLIEKPTTNHGTLLDHIYIKPIPQEYTSSVMTTHYSYHNPTFVAIKY